MQEMNGWIMVLMGALFGLGIIGAISFFYCIISFLAWVEGLNKVIKKQNKKK
jgi:uncharacterized membrane protein